MKRLQFSPKFALLLISIMLTGAAEEPAAPTPTLPEESAEFPQSSDIDWLKGRFEGASSSEQRRFYQIMERSNECQKEAAARLRSELAQRGFPEAQISDFGVGPVECRTVIAPVVPEGASWDAFMNAWHRVSPMIETYILAVEIAERTSAPDAGSPLRSQLVARTVGEQMLRYASNWGNGEMSDAPPVSGMERSILTSRIWAETAKRDHENTRWLKRVVEMNGWPRISDVGEKAADAAWLLAQHADADPLFQLDALQAMEPLVTSNEVRPQNFALLKDRVTLKLAGYQRYGTQYECRDNQFVPRMLEDADKVEAWRAEVGLDSLVENQQRIRKSFGSC